MTKRERMIAIGVGVVAGLYVFDQWLLEPYVERLNTAQTAIADRQTALDQANTTLKTKKQRTAEWKTVSAGRLPDNRQAAETQLLAGAQECATDASLQINTYKPDKVEQEKGFDRLLLRVTATGSMQQIGRFLFAVEHSADPVKVVDLQINSRKDGTDDLTMTAGLMTIYRAQTAAKIVLGPTRTEAGQ